MSCSPRCPEARHLGQPWSWWTVRCGTRATRQVDSGGTAKYTYNALNQRVRIDAGGAGSEYVFNPSGQRASAWNITGAQFQGQTYWGTAPVEFYASAVAHFQHQDWLGTERLRTTYNGGVEGTFSSLPFGDGYSVSGADDDGYHFAGMDQDSTSNDHAQFRQYSNMAGRWMSPDPYRGSYAPTNPQSMNRYAYGMNSALAYTDPSGLYIAVHCAGCWGSGNPEGGNFGGDGEFATYDWVSSSSGTFTYADDVWNNTMQDGFGGGVTEDGSGELYSSAETGYVPLGATGQMLAPTGSVTVYSMMGGTFFGFASRDAPNNGKKTPLICGGTFGFGGLEADAVEGGAFAGGIVESDSQNGMSGGSLVEAWLGGEGPVAGVGKITSPSDTSVLQGFLGFVGAGINAGPLAGLQVGYVAGKGWGGLYVEGHVGVWAAGTGGYLRSCSGGD